MRASLVKNSAVRTCVGTKTIGVFNSSHQLITPMDASPKLGQQTLLSRLAAPAPPQIVRKETNLKIFLFYLLLPGVFSQSFAFAEAA